MQTYTDIACGVVYATNDYAKYDSSYHVTDVKNAFKQVGINTSNC